MNENLKTILISVGIILTAAIIGTIIGTNRLSATEAPERAATAATEAATQTATQAVNRESLPASVGVPSPMVTLGVGESCPVGALYDNSRSADGAVYAVDRADVLSVDARAI